MRKPATLAFLVLITAVGCSHRNLQRQAQSLLEPALVSLAKHDNGWVLLINGEPFFVKGVHYEPASVGQDPELGDDDWTDWAHSDLNANGLADAPYDAFVDANFDSEQDDDEPSVGDFALMQAMGVNTLMWYHNAYSGWLPNKDVLRDLYLTHKIRVAVGDYLGAYPQSLGYEWNPGTDYTNPHHRQVLLESVRKMVLEHKDEPYVLIWLLGYENNWARSSTNAAVQPEAYVTLLNDAAKLIHELDDRHPVAVVNADLGFLELYAELAPEVDILGVNSERGEEGFGALWLTVKEILDRPVLITLYGGVDAPAYLPEEQMRFHRERWNELSAQRAGSGYGNAIGGIAFEWLDQWWRAGRPGLQLSPESAALYRGQTASSALEWSGLWSQGNGHKSPFVRQPRLVYCMYQILWNESLDSWLPWCDSRPELDAMAVRRLREQEQNELGEQ